MDYWPDLPPVGELPADYRAWAWWLRNGPRRRQGTIGGSMLFRVVRQVRLLTRPLADPYVTLHAPPRPALTIDLNDFESFHHALPVWYHGDVEATLVQRLLSPGQTYLDAGANFGVYALYAAGVAGVRVCAIEPQPHLVEAIRRSARENGLDNMIVVEAAVTKDDGVIDLLVSRIGSGSASIRPDRGGPSAMRLRVRAVKIDTVIAEHGLAPVGVLKMDVEDAEALVLRGACDLLDRDAPFVLFEAGSQQPQDEVFAILRNAGYQSFHDETSVRANRLVDPRLDQPLTNVVAVPHGRDARQILEPRP